jgi:hypothetical protein
VAFNPDGQLLASGAYDNTVKLWDVASGKLRHTLKSHGGSVWSVAFSPNGHRLASGSDDSTVKLWSTKSGGLLHTYKGRAGPIRSVAFSPDGRFLAAGAYDDTVKLWDVASRRMHQRFEGHGGSVRSVAFSPNGRFLASGSDDNTVKLWEIGKKDAVATLMGGKRQSWLAVDGRKRVLRGDDGTLLRRRSEANGDFQPVPVIGMAQQDFLEATLEPESLSIQLGQSGELRARITNTGRQPAFWLHLKPSASQDNTLRLDPPHNLFQGKGLQVWKQTRIARLDPGETASLHACIKANLKLPASFLASGGRDLDIVLATANGTENIQTVKADLQSPELQWQRALLETDSRTLRLNLVNRGKARLNAFTLNFYAVDETRTDSPAAKLLSQQAFESLGPAGTNELAVILPGDLDLQTARLELRGRTRELPVFVWALKQPEIEEATRILPWILVVALSVLVLSAVFYLNRYRHPLVVQLSKDPAALLQLPPEQLAEARACLSRTNRLAATLAEAEVTEQTLNAAITFIEEKKPEEKAKWLASRLGAFLEAVPPSLWELHLPDTFPLNLDRCLVCFPPAETKPRDLDAELRAVPQSRMQTTLLIGPDSVYQRKLREKTDDRTNKLVAPHGGDLTELLLSHTPETVLTRILADQLTLSQLSPYKLGGGVDREAVFFGRQKIIAHIMNRDPANYLVVSGRQLGKSSLLKALERRYRDRPEVSCHYLALASEALVPRLATELKLPPEAGLEGIAAHVATSGQRFLFLIDEADKFVRWERANDYPVLDALRRMSEEGHAHFILAGFWELYDHAVLDYQSPLKNFAEIIELGELESEACRELAEVPMRNMRLSYADKGLVEQLLRQTGQRANLMAITCHQILFQLKSNQRVIQADDVQRALSSDKTLNALKGWASMTDDEAACRLDRIVVYATVELDRFKLGDLVTTLERHGLQPDANKLDRSLDRLELGFVLAREPGGRYYYRVPLFRKMVLRDDPQARLKIELDARG